MSITAYPAVVGFKDQYLYELNTAESFQPRRKDKMKIEEMEGRESIFTVRDLDRKYKLGWFFIGGRGVTIETLCTGLFQDSVSQSNKCEMYMKCTPIHHTSLTHHLCNTN